MAVTISTFTIPTVDIFGFDPPALAGFSDVIGSGTITNGSVVAFGGNGVRGLLWQASTDRITFEVYGLHENEGWDYITINGVNYSRSSASAFSRFGIMNTNASNNYTNGGVYTQWYWNNVPNFPFASYASGSTQAITINHSGSVPASGPISLNEIHQEAGGSSGTQVSLNDSDVRALNWYNTVAGSAIASGGTNTMRDYLYPCNVGEKQSTQRRRLYSNTTNDLNYKLASALATITTAPNLGIFANTKCGMTIEFDGTDTRLRYHLFSVVNNSDTNRVVTLSNQYWTTLASGTGNPQTYSAVTNDAITFEGVQVIEAALLTSQHNESIDSTVGAKTYDQSQFGETLMSTNSITSFVNIAANTQYGRSYNIRNNVPPTNQTLNERISKVDCRFRWALRLLGYSPEDRTFVEKEETLNFMISLYVSTKRGS